MKTTQNDYPLIPMSEITDEAREIAVAWMECDDRSWIEQKHKLASDIMNYARRHNKPKAIDWNKLRDKFFNECTEIVTLDEAYSNQTMLKKVNLAPHDLFEWFKKELTA